MTTHSVIDSVLHVHRAIRLSLSPRDKLFIKSACRNVAFVLFGLVLVILGIKPIFAEPCAYLEHSGIMHGCEVVAGFLGMLYCYFDKIDD